MVCWDACMTWFRVSEYLQQVFLCQHTVGVMAGCQYYCLRSLWCSGLSHTSVCGVTGVTEEFFRTLSVALFLTWRSLYILYILLWAPLPEIRDLLSKNGEKCMCTTQMLIASISYGYFSPLYIVQENFVHKFCSTVYVQDM